MSSCGRRRGEKDRVGKGEKRKYTGISGGEEGVTG